MWVFQKSFMGDYKHVGRRLAQSTRANIITESKATAGVRDKADIRGHDLRRTAASLMASGVPRFVISRILNHSEERDITSVYDRYGYDSEKKTAMNFWNRQLAAILKGQSAAGVGRFAMRSQCPVCGAHRVCGIMMPNSVGTLAVDSVGAALARFGLLIRYRERSPI